MKLKALPVVVLLIVISVFFLTPASSQLTYADGYQAGKKAARVDVRNDQNPYFGSTKYLTLPDHRIEQIKNKPSAYQRGFREGYKESAKQTLVESPDYWGGYILAMLGSVAVLALLLSLS